MGYSQNSLTSCIYDMALGRSNWDSILDILSASFPGCLVLVSGDDLVSRTNIVFAQRGLQPSAVSAYVNTFAALNPWLEGQAAVADVFGTNLFNVTIIFAVDALYDGPPVLAEVGPFAGFGALLAIALTAIYLAGMIERRDRTLARMGYDSIAALFAYAGGLVVLWHLR